MKCINIYIKKGSLCLLVFTCSSLLMFYVLLLGSNCLAKIMCKCAGSTGTWYCIIAAEWNVC